MFVRNDKQYVWPYIVLVLSILCFIPWIMNKINFSPALTMVREEVSDYLLFVWLPTVGNILIVAFLIIWFGGPMISGMLKERKETIEKSIDEAAHVKLEAEHQYQEAETNLENLDGELREMRASYARSIEAEKARILEETARQEKRIESDAEVVFELQTNVATRAFEREVMSSALDRARDEIVQKLASDASLRDRLIDQGIAGLNVRA